MPFEKVETQVDFPAQERAVLALWQKADTFERLRAQNRGKPKWSFLDGPITANNPMGVHHAWGRTYKDAYQRYFAMTGHELRYQNGFDCQGLWVEVEVEKELDKEREHQGGLKSKRDIENLVPGDRFASIDYFVQRCKKRVDKFAKTQTEQSIRLGYWMDWDHDEDWEKRPDDRRSYFTMSEENNYTIWSFLKKCHTRGLVYRGYDAMPWCPRCAVGLSQMEMHEGYQLVAHRAPFVAFPLRGRIKENLLIWTTTPWTLTSNVAAAVNPELTYLKVRLKDQVYYLGKGAWTAQRLEEQFKRKEWVEGVPKLKSLEQHFKEKAGKDGYEILGELKGAELVGLAYDGPFDELPAQSSAFGHPSQIAEVVRKQGWATDKAPKEQHRVIAWDAVGETEGTGIVHIAPGCGREDFELGKHEKLPPVAPLDEEGVFVAGFGPLEGKSAVDPGTADWVLDNLHQKGLLVAVEKYPHSYPHCWRCKTELLFRLVDEWFINMQWRDEIMKVVEDVTFLPESINGKARELDWLRNMGDWMISKKRFWGLALPIWVCESCGQFDVIGSHTELRERAVAGWDRFEGKPPHRPWVDLLKIQCTACGGTASRIGDVGNPWLDAGIVPYSTMGYNRDRDYWKQWFPADFITECFPGQFRNWFYAILAMSTMMEQKAPFKVLLGHGLVRDQWGEEMHKSKGNAIPFEGAADGVDLPGRKEKGYVIKHERKSHELPVDLSAAYAVEEAEEVRDGKKVKVVTAYCPPMSADLMRWMYCRHNPSANINFGPGSAGELLSKFTMKLWNTYAFFCNYARLDDFDAGAKPVPVKDRPDIDRWILSDLQLLVKKAHESFQSFDIEKFCKEAEDYVDNRLSNWYVRRNRRRFWKSEKGTDKLAAYQTLHTVLVTLARLFAPIMPFLTETLYRNLVPEGAKDTASVHLTEYPVADEALIDEALSHEMEALLRLKTLGGAARNTAAVKKTRQPMAEMKVLPSEDVERRAIERFESQLCDELNIKKVTVAQQGPLLSFEVKLNPKSLGPRGLGQRIAEIQKALAAADTAAIVAAVHSGSKVELDCPNGRVTLEPTDFFMQPKAPEGWTGVVDGTTQVLLDTRVTPELAREGMAREVVRFVQDSRKKAGLEMEDRIELYLDTPDPELQEALRTHRAYIAGETLTSRWAEAPLGAGAFESQVKVDGKALTIQLRKAS